MAHHQYQTVEKGTSNTLSYRVYLRDEHGFISPFHDIPLRPAGGSENEFNMFVEISRWSNAKMEISKEEPLNPIKQDVKKGKLRFVDNVFPHRGYMWNYGAFPQTWENPATIDEHTQAKGDNDPIDVMDISDKLHPRGSVVRVKVLAVLGLIDEGETDWKIITIDVTDPRAALLNDVADIEREMPGYLKATVEWFRYYKVPTGKPENKFAFEGQVMGREFALKLIEDAHREWLSLMEGRADAAGIKCLNTKNAHGGTRIEQAAAVEIVEKNEPFHQGEPIPAETYRWSFITEELLRKNNAQS